MRDVFGDVPVQRCQWHKRENVVSYLAKPDQPKWRRKLEAAYGHATHGDAKRALDRLQQEPRIVNESAAASLAEGLDETLTLHRLNVFTELGVSFRSTNLIESVMARPCSSRPWSARSRARNPLRRKPRSQPHRLNVN